MKNRLKAKTYTCIEETYSDMNDFIKAEKAFRESVRIFKVTCGVSPLTADALRATIYSRNACKHACAFVRRGDAACSG